MFLRVDLHQHVRCIVGGGGGGLPRRSLSRSSCSFRPSAKAKVAHLANPYARPGPLSYQGSIATGHTYGGAEGARKFFCIPLANIASLPAQAVEHPNAILEPNLDSNTHPNPQPAPTPTPNPTHDPNPKPNPNPNQN